MSKTMSINAGSSSLKWKLYDMPQETVLASGIVERIGLADSIFTIDYYNGKRYEVTLAIAEHETAVRLLLEQLIQLSIISEFSEITGVGHRVAAGGESFSDSVVITPAVLEEIQRLAELAPLHNPANAMGIRAFKNILPEITSVAVFDTSFHQTMDKTRYLYSIPMEYYKEHNVRKYGYHGTSHKYVSERAAVLLKKPLEKLKLISCHLGNGASVCAIEGGKSVDTSMGFTPLAGLTMGTRSGDIDVSILPYLMEKESISDINEMIWILNNQSGLKGISSVSSDMRDLHALEDSDEQAALALRIFEDRVKKYIGAYAALMDGVDAIIFTAGIGENDIQTRKNIVDGLSYLNAELSDERNDCRGVERVISSNQSAVQILLIPTDEEVMIARDVERLR
ncbi:acetate kinase [Alkalibacterium subtropicum]|uniref:Acetate kinase n=1 Tax=Alkalibacterium subtropicum TaxID=753702 RepID=A0A1I1GYR9_9LACT|nr:acetate kinase [Alkalibacterium subtropicum]SFC16804.1 acetate kinase [Alkalibacterium subtropicum]